MTRNGFWNGESVCIHMKIVLVWKYSLKLFDVKSLAPTVRLCYQRKEHESKHAFNDRKYWKVFGPTGWGAYQKLYKERYVEKDHVSSQREVRQLSLSSIYQYMSTVAGCTRWVDFRIHTALHNFIEIWRCGHIMNKNSIFVYFFA